MLLFDRLDLTCGSIPGQLGEAKPFSITEAAAKPHQFWKHNHPQLTCTEGLQGSRH